MTELSKKNIGIFVDSQKISGGAFHELSSFIKSVEEYNKDFKLNFIIICTSKKTSFNESLTKFKTVYFEMNLFKRYFHYLFNHHHLFRRLRKFLYFKNSFESFLARHEIDYVIFTGPSQYALYLENISYALSIQDVAHRENVEFPELGSAPLFTWKDEIYRKAAIRASMIFTNSQVIKKRISFFYSILEERIYVINQQPSLSVKNFKGNKTDDSIINFKKNNKLPNNYIFYPAMYLPHKNHKYIIDVIDILNNNQKLDISAVFCGSDKGYLKNLKEYSKKKNLSDKIKFLDFVKDEELPYLYINSLALAMPTLIGPTNIPPWEAFKLNIPVLYSDFGNIRSILKDAVYYIDPFQPESMAKGIKKIFQEKNFKDDLVKKGSELLNSINFKKDFEQILKSIIHNRIIRNRWIFD
jgi:glycosyltransferase involved in cell wall biosynthesis